MVGGMRRLDLPLLSVLACGFSSALLLGTWVLDDAGISMAYALTLADGHGLRAQPGGAAELGYSNLAWVLWCSIPMGLVRDPVLVAKALGGLCWLGTTLTLAWTFRGTGAWGRLAVLSLVALHPAVLVWGLSGMENGLTAWLSAGLLSVWAQPAHTRRSAMWAGGLAGLLAWTRPEALLIGLITPLALLAPREGPGRILRALTSLATWGGLVLLQQLIHLWAFSSVVPLPFLTKGTRLVHNLAAPLTRPVEVATETASRVLPGLGHIADRASLPEWSNHGLALVVLVALFVATAADCFRTWRDPHRGWALPVAVAIAWLSFLSLPPDGFGPFRYATAPIVLHLGWLVSVGGWPHWILVPLAALGLIQGPGIAAHIASDPPVPLQRVIDDAVALGIVEDDPEVWSIATPDVGAALLWSTRCIRDLGLLTDGELALAARSGELTDVLLGSVQPDLIATHQEWTALYRLDADPRFATDYVAVETWEDAWASDRAGTPLRSGVFLRTELATPERLARLREGRDARATWPRNARGLQPLPSIPAHRGCPEAP